MVRGKILLKPGTDPLFKIILALVLACILSLPSSASDLHLEIEGFFESKVEYSNDKTLEVSGPLEAYLHLYQGEDLLLEVDLLPEGLDLLEPQETFEEPQVKLARVIARGPFFKGGRALTITAGSIWIHGNLLNPYGVNAMGLKIQGFNVGQATARAYLIKPPWAGWECLLDLEDNEPPLMGDMSLSVNSEGDIMGGFDGSLFLGSHAIARLGYKDMLGRKEYHTSVESWLGSLSGGLFGGSFGYKGTPDGKKGLDIWLQANFKDGTSLGLSYTGAHDLMQGSLYTFMGPYQVKIVAETGIPSLILASRDFYIGHKTLLSMDVGTELWGLKVLPKMGVRIESIFRLGSIQDIKLYGGYAWSRFGEYMYGVGEYRTPHDIQFLATYLVGKGGEETEEISPGFNLSISKIIEF